jgi:hypothetical protein
MRRTTVFLLGAAVWGALSIGLWLWAASRPWVPQADFDILGVLWLLTNLPRLFLSGFALLCLVPAGYCLRRVWRSST